MAWPAKAPRCCKGSSGVATVDARWACSIMQPQKSARPPISVNWDINRTGRTRICQSMTARPVDAAVAQAFLEAVSPLGVEVAEAVLDQAEQQLLAQRRQWELQLEQARYEARLAQRKYDAVDPDNRLVAAELERRWNAQLTRVAELEQAYAKAEQEASWSLTPEERAAMQTLAQDLCGDLAGRDHHPCRAQAIAASGHRVGAARWGEPSRVDRDPDSLALRRGDAPGRAARQAGRVVLENPAQAVARIHELAAESSYAEIADALNTAGWRTAFGRPFTSQHVGYICRRDGCGRNGLARLKVLIKVGGEERWMSSERYVSWYRMDSRLRPS